MFNVRHYRQLISKYTVRYNTQPQRAKYTPGTTTRCKASTKTNYGPYIGLWPGGRVVSDGLAVNMSRFKSRSPRCRVQPWASGSHTLPVPPGSIIWYRCKLVTVRLASHLPGVTTDNSSRPVTIFPPTYPLPSKRRWAPPSMLLWLWHILPFIPDAKMVILCHICGCIMSWRQRIGQS